MLLVVRARSGSYVLGVFFILALIPALFARIKTRQRIKATRSKQRHS